MKDTKIMRKAGMSLDALSGPGWPSMLVVALLTSCVSGLPQPKYVQQKTEALVQVGYPPPPGRVEFIPARPPGDPVWLDGEWAWSGSKWAWVAGRWVIAPTGASFAPWTTVRDELGNVYFASGSWHDASGGLISPPPPLATAASMAGDVTSPEGDDQKTATPPIALPSSADAAPP